jgi:hypothetical protein
VVVDSGLTDILGYTVFTLKAGYEYKYIISYSNYDTREFLFTPYPINSPYTFVLKKSASNPFFNVFDYVSYNYYPKTTSVNQSLNTFSLTSQSDNGTIIYTYIKCNNESDNVTGSPQGATSQVIINTTNYNSSVVNCLFEFKFDIGSGNFTPQIISFNRTYNIIGIAPAGESIVDSAKDIKDDVANGSWLAILSYCIIIVAVGLVNSWSDGNRIATAGVTCALIIVFSAIEWIDPLIGGLIAFIGLALLFMGSR